MKKTVMNPTEILRQPYGRLVVPDSDGTYRAEIVEFPGCIATGDTAAEALTNLEATAWDWLEAVIERGQHIPEPVEAAEYSGKLVVRLPKSLHKKAAYHAARDGVSLNQFIVTSIAEQVGTKAATYDEGIGSRL
jgi:predicted RNase H-like HicB family nuclease